MKQWFIYIEEVQKLLDEKYSNNSADENKEVQTESLHKI